MGAEFNVKRVNVPASALKAEYNRLVEQAQYEHGHGGYTGTIAESPGLRIVSEEFRTREAAEDWLDAHCVKWEDTLAVRVFNEKDDYWLLGGVYSC